VENTNITLIADPDVEILLAFIKTSNLFCAPMFAQLAASVTKVMLEVTKAFAFYPKSVQTNVTRTKFGMIADRSTLAKLLAKIQI
jgi:hypothetical protein